MSNKQPPSPKRTFTDLVNSSDYLQRAVKRNRDALDRFFLNNAYLLSQKNISVYRQLKTISERSGFNISKQLYHGLKVGNRKVCNTAIVFIISEYWGMDGSVLMAEDIRPEEYRNKVA